MHQKEKGGGKEKSAKLLHKINNEKADREKKLSKTKSQRYEIKVQKISRYQVSIIVQCSNMNERRFVRIIHRTENMKLIHC